MLHTFLLSVFLAHLTGSNFMSAWAKTSAPRILSEEEITRQYSLSDLYSALNGLRSVIDGQTWCGVKFEEAKNSILPLRPIFEKKLASEKEKNKSVKKLIAQSKKCKKTCGCKIYSELLKGRTDIGAEDFAQIERLERATTSKDLNLCAKRQTQICKGPLLRSLQAISKKEYQAPSDF